VKPKTVTAKPKSVAKAPLFRHLVLERPLVIIDLETTGLNTETARIVELGLILILPDNYDSQIVLRLNPGVPIPAEASNVHGIFDADVADEPRFADIADTTLSRLSFCDLCGFNISRFDLPILQNEFARVGMSLPLQGRAIVDVMTIFHDCIKRQPGVKRDLTAAVHLYCNQNHDKAHSAGADAQATAVAVQSGLGWPDGEFLAAYNRNRGAANQNHDKAHSAGADALATAHVLDGLLQTHEHLPRTITGLHERFNVQQSERLFREIRAQDMRSQGCRVIQDNAGWLVSSQTSRGVFYTVTLDPEPSCTCQDFLKRRKVCKHIIFLDAFLAENLGDN